MVRRMKIPLGDVAATVARPDGAKRNRRFDERQAARRMSVSGILVEPGANVPMDLLALRIRHGPSSLLLVRIWPSVTMVKRPSARDCGRSPIWMRPPHLLRQARTCPSPPVIAGAVTSTAAVASGGEGDERDDDIVVRQRREDEVLGQPPFEMIVDVEHALAAIGRPIASRHISSAWPRTRGWTVRRGRGGRTPSPCPRLSFRLLADAPHSAFWRSSLSVQARSLPSSPVQCAMLVAAMACAGHRVRRHLEDDFAAIVEDEAAVLSEREVGRELARSPQAAGEQQRGCEREQTLVQ